MPPIVSSAAQTGIASASAAAPAGGEKAERKDCDDSGAGAEADTDRDPDELALDLEHGQLDLEPHDRPGTVDQLLRGPGDTVRLQ